MLNWVKFSPSFFVLGVLQVCAGLPVYESFHSNMGELLILSPVIHRSVPVQTLNKPDLATPELSKNQADQSSGQSSLEGDIEDQTKTVDKKNKLVLSDEQIEELLFDELLDWGEVEKDEEVDIILETPDWYQFYAAEMGWGYSDNPMGAAHNTESSSFAELNLESFFLNQKNPQHQALIYLLAEGKNFYQLKSEEISGLILSQFEYTYKPTGEDRSYGLQFQHTYFDQGMDFSELGNPPEPQKITSQRFELSPHFKWAGDEGEEGKLQLSWSKERLRQFPDQNSKFGISVSLSNQFAEPLKWQAKLFRILTKYKDREPRDGSGNSLSGILETKHTGLSVKLTSPQENGWSKDLYLGTTVEKVDDNHAGYYDYKRCKATLGKKWETERWASDLSLGYNRTNYSQRLVDNQEKFSKDHWSLEFGIFRELNQYWKTYAKWMHESDSSNDPDFAYESNFWSLGMAWEK